MSDRKRFMLLVLVVAGAILVFYSIGQEAIDNGEQINSDSVNLSNFPTGTPRPQIFRLIREALKRNPRPTLPPDS
jgi:hypothetical protein